ncbi:hypothetical protein TIFTF001_009038 [Ficus carica]|uniref:Uncharacterized protein n=1 Tax=Ficus carica TaxID=3494 RepID=A0AA88D3B2_FICCA|nr:hypothetical protein TIFTF001_009038 [Ficus carica]
MPKMGPAATPNVVGRLSRVWVLGTIQLDRLPRAPGGRLGFRPADTIGPMDWRQVVSKMWARETPASPRHISQGRVLGAQSSPHLVRVVRISFHVPGAQSEVVFRGRSRSQHQYNPPGSGLTWPGMLSVLVWSIVPQTRFSSSWCSRLFGSGHVLGEDYSFGCHASASAPC